MATIYLAYTYVSRYTQLEDEAFDAAETKAAVAAAQISVPFAELMAIADSLADELSEGVLPYDEIETRLFEIVDDRPDIDGIAITFEPFVYAPDTRLFQTYVFQQADGTFDSLVGATYDYTLPPDQTDNDTSWYVDTIEEGAQWHEPFFATGAQDILVEYAVPFYPVGVDAPEAAPAGIVTIDYTLRDVHDLIRELELGATGYGFVISGEGTFLTHPVSEFVINRSVFDITDGNEALTNSAETAINGRRAFVETVDPVTGQTTWYFFEPISLTGWTVGLVLAREQFLPNPHQSMRDQMTIALSAAATVFFLATTIFHMDRYRFTNFWWMSATFSILCVLLIVLAWVLTNRLDQREGIHINSPSELDRYIESLQTSVTQDDAPVQVPTGVFIQALQFPDPISVTFNGYIWQRYSTDADIQRGFALPQRIGEEATLEEVQREVIDGEEVIIWYVGVTLRQAYDTTRFPFDHRNIVLRLNPVDLGANVILTPDLDAYELINPRLLPGVDPQASINNWILRNSGYSYITERLNTNLGIASRQINGSTPELRFEVQAQRIYLGPFIAYLLPGMIAAAMTFGYLVSGREVGNKDEIVGVLNYAAALFFVVAVIHTALREQIAAVGITYMEHLYILLYLAIVAVAANVFVVASYPHWQIVQYQNNLMPKVLYWPIFAGGMLLSTLFIFVY